jgi:uncharacterized protein (UPF0335 family)
MAPEEELIKRLLEERERLKKELEAETDPVLRAQIEADIKEVEADLRSLGYAV